MKFDSQVQKLEDLMRLDSGYPFKSSEWVNYGVPVIKIRNVQDGYVDLNSCSFVNEKSANKASDWLGKLGNTLIALTGAGVGEIGRILENQEGLINQRVGWVRPINLEDEDFIYYLLRFYKSQIIELASGSAQPNVSPKDILRIACRVPNKQVRKSIGFLLSSIDKKINMNKQLSKTLEDFAQAIFKSWFIDFDPVKAKMNGEKPIGMDDETAALFPDSFEESELGLIPKGWEVTELDNNFKIVMGQSPPGSTYNSLGVGLPFYQGSTYFGDRFPDVKTYCSVSKRIAEPGDTILCVRANVGLINQSYMECILGRGVASIIHLEHLKSYTYYFMKSVYTKISTDSFQGSVILGLTSKDLAKYRVLSPALQLLKKFDSIIQPMDDLILGCFLESKNLIKLRESLLPRLISGELQIPDEMLAS